MSVLLKVIRHLMLAATVMLPGISGAGSIAAYAQTTFGDCSSLDGYVFTRVHSAAVTSVSNTITTLADDDLITVDMTYTSGAGGDISGVVSISGTTIFSETITYGGGGAALGATVTRSITYDPPTSGTGVAFNFASDPFTSAEGEITFAVTCVAGAGVVPSVVTPPASSIPTAPTTTTTTVTNAAGRVSAIERVRRLLEEHPDRARFVRKRLKALWSSDQTNDVALADALTRNSNTPPKPVQVAAAGSSVPLVGMSARDATLAAYAYTDDKDADTCGMDHNGLPSLSCVDVWTEAHYTRFNEDNDRKGNFTVVYAGADMHLTPWAIIGLLGQMDWLVDDIKGADTRTESIGWMTGPYASMRLSPEIFMDFRAAWGRSDTDISTLGITGNYASTRWLATAQITGNFQMGDTRLSPEISVEYIKEISDDFTSSSGASVDVGEVSIGRLRFGPEIARMISLDGGMAIEPRVAVRGIWDFNEADVVTLNNVEYNTGSLRGLVEAGAIVHGIHGVNISIAGKYEGLGLRDFEAYGGMLWVNVPL